MLFRSVDRVVHVAGHLEECVLIFLCAEAVADFEVGAFPERGKVTRKGLDIFGVDIVQEGAPGQLVGGPPSEVPGRGCGEQDGAVGGENVQEVLDQCSREGKSAAR